MIITFKDVGQGDSILMEWEENSIPKIGIIDCNRINSTNPVLEHLISVGYSEIEFAILSHPHKDHYSGFADLFNYCIDENIRIKRFYETIRHLDDYYWKFFEVDTESNGYLFKMLENLNKLYDNKLTEFSTLDIGTSIRIGDHGTLECFSPSRYETDILRGVMGDDPDKNKSKVSHSANLLSSIFLLRYNGKEALLTSDAETETFDRLLNESHDICADSRIFSICQVPHHGSIKNYHPVFWENAFREGAIGVLSAGTHGKYNHPHFETLEQLDSLGYLLHSTNFVNGVKEFYESINDITIVLDTVSDLDEEAHFLQGDQSYILEMDT